MKTSKTIEVQWGEIDAAMHVNNVTYLKWVESARVDFLIKMNNGMLVNEEHIGADSTRQIGCHFKTRNCFL